MKRTKLTARAEVVQQADESVVVIDPMQCFFQPCPGCSNCDRMVRS